MNKDFFKDYNHEKHTLLRLTLNLELRNLVANLKIYFHSNPPKFKLKQLYNQFLDFTPKIEQTYLDMRAAEEGEKRKTKKMETDLIMKWFDSINHYSTLGLFPADEDYNLMVKAYNLDSKKFSSITNRLNKKEEYIQLMSEQEYNKNIAYTSLLIIYNLLRYTHKNGSEWHDLGLHKVVNLLIQEFEKIISKSQYQSINYIMNKIADADLTQKVVIGQVLQAYNTDDEAVLKISEKILKCK